MVFQSKSAKKNSDRIFIHREWISLVIIFLLVTIGNRIASPIALFAAAIFIAICILRSNVSNSFYWALFLIPNIRMLDDTGISFIVNAMMALPLVVYFFRTSATRIPAIALLGSVTLCFMELAHDIVLSDLSNFVIIVGWVLNIFFCILVTIDSRVQISKDDVFSALSTGIIMSAATYLVAGLTSISRVLGTINSGARFTAFADDPNYYSLYICLTIACILNVKDKNIYKFCVLLLLVGIGLLTASKMCILLMVFEFALIFIQIFNSSKHNKSNKKFIAGMSMGLISVLIILKDYVRVFLNNFIRRLGSIGSNSFSINQLTTGRLALLVDYLEIMTSNVSCLLVGYGFNYHLYLDQASKKSAHNTYMDLLLSWGIVGTIIFIVIIYCWIEKYKRSRNINKIGFVNLIPMIVLLINFLDLSCLSASMFPFVVAVVMIQWLPKNEQINTTQGEEK